MLDAVISLQFSTVETIWRHFWRSANNNEAVDVGMEEDPEKMLPKYYRLPCFTIVCRRMPCRILWDIGQEQKGYLTDTFFFS